MQFRGLRPLLYMLRPSNEKACLAIFKSSYYNLLK